MSFKKSGRTIQLWRHATLTLKINGVTILIDPMLSPKEYMDPVGNAGNDIRIPMVDLPFPPVERLKGVDAIFVTHTHRDHWDPYAQSMIDKSKLIFCQPADAEKIKGQGFLNVTAVEDKAEFKGLTIHRTGGQHGTGEIGQKMGPVSGFVFDNAVYVAGDTIYCKEVESALVKFRPQIVIANCGGAQFLTGDPITMNSIDIETLSSTLPSSKIIAVHMDTVNHCKVTRGILKKFVAENKLENVLIPADGETLTF